MSKDRRARGVSMNDEEHRKFMGLGGARYLRGAIERDWEDYQRTGKLPAQARATPTSKDPSELPEGDYKQRARRVRTITTKAKKGTR